MQFKNLENVVKITKFMTEYTSTDSNIEAKYHKNIGNDTKEKLRKSQRQVSCFSLLFFAFSKH